MILAVISTSVMGDKQQQYQEEEKKKHVPTQRKEKNGGTISLPPYQGDLEESEESSGDSSKDKSKSSLDRGGSAESVVIIARLVDIIRTAAAQLLLHGEVAHPSLATEIELSGLREAQSGDGQSHNLVVLVNIEFIAGSKDGGTVLGALLAVVGGLLRVKEIERILKEFEVDLITSPVSSGSNETLSSKLALVVQGLVGVVAHIRTEDVLLDEILVGVVDLLGDEATLDVVLGAALHLLVRVDPVKLDVPLAVTLGRGVFNSSSNCNDCSDSKDSKSSHYVFFSKKQ